jgi:hypothetical protein
VHVSLDARDRQLSFTPQLDGRFFVRLLGGKVKTRSIFKAAQAVVNKLVGGLLVFSRFSHYRLKIMLSPELPRYQ